MEYLLFITISVFFGFVCFVLILPGWLYSRRRKPESYLLFITPVVGLLFWLFLGLSGYGQQSLGNLVEMYIVAGFCVLSSYFKMFVANRYFPRTFASIWTLVVLILGFVFMLRTLMPSLPE